MGRGSPGMALALVLFWHSLNIMPYNNFGIGWYRMNELKIMNGFYYVGYVGISWYGFGYVLSGMII